MWVFCCGMYRSASNLQFQITTRLVRDAGAGQGGTPIRYYEVARGSSYEAKQQAPTDENLILADSGGGRQIGLRLPSCSPATPCA